MIDLLKNKIFKKSEEDANQQAPDKELSKDNPPKQLSAEEIAKKEFEQLEKYRDLEGLTISKLNLGFWWVKNRPLILKIIKIILIIISVITWSLFIFTFGKYLLFDMKKDDQMISELANGPTINHEVVLAISPQNFQVQTIRKFNLLSGHYDFLAEITNPNKWFSAKFDYYFLVDGIEYGRQPSYIFPNETKYLFALSQEISSAPDIIEFKVDNIIWQRIDSRQYPDWENYKNERLKISTANINFTPAKSTVLSEKLDLNELKFDLSNNTIFNYWEVNLKILLYSHDDIADINEYKVTDLKSDEKRTIVISWPGRFGYISDITIIPEIDITNKNNYINYNEGPGEVK